MKILVLTQKFSGCGYHRLMLPVSFMPKEYGRITDTITEEELAENKYDIVFVNRIWEKDDLLELRKKDVEAQLSPPIMQQTYGAGVYTFGGLYNTNGIPFIDRNLALQVPAVSRCRNLICGVIASIDLELIQKSTGRKLQTPVWLDQPDIRQPRSVTISYTVDSLLLYGVAYWRVTSLYEEDGRPSGFEWVANTRVTVTTDQYGDEVDYYSVNGQRVPDSGGNPLT